MTHSDQPVAPSAVSAQSELEALTQQLAESTQNYEAVLEREKRVLADYQNLVRRSQEDRLRFAKLAASEFALSLLQPLDHLVLASHQLKDKGLDMVVAEFQLTLKEQGLEEVPVIGKAFDVATMEVVEKQGKAEKVVAVVSRGYKLNGEVIRHAKVVLG